MSANHSVTAEDAAERWIAVPAALSGVHTIVRHRNGKQTDIAVARFPGVAHRIKAVPEMERALREIVALDGVDERVRSLAQDALWAAEAPAVWPASAEEAA